MKQIFLMLFAAGLFSCGNTAVDSCDDHDHATENHDHSSENGHNHAEEDEHDHSAEAAAKPADAHNHEGGITLSEAQAKALELTYEKIEPSSFSAAVQVSGAIEPSTNDNYTVIANTSGIVKIAQSGLNIGSSVGAGEKIFVIEAGNLTDNNVENRLSIARTALNKAQADHDRVISLSKDNLVTATQVEEVKLALITAQKNYDALTKSQSISSQIKGYITALNVKNGDFVTEGQALATVSSGKSLVIKADLPSRYFSLLPAITSANFVTPYDNATYTMFELNGKLLSRGHSVSTGSYSVPVLFSVDNRANLIAGTAIEVFLITTKKENIVSVPSSALTEEQGAFYVYIRTCVDSYEKVAVKIGDSNGQRTEILSGLHKGDNVVTSGAYFVRLASASNSIPHGHAH